MTAKDQIFTTIRAHRLEICEKFSVESLALFGSIARDSGRVGSDVDILVRYRKTPSLFQFIDLKHYLEKLLGRPVDLVTEKALKAQLRDKILKEAVLVS